MTEPHDFDASLRAQLDHLREHLDALELQIRIDRVGRVVESGDGVALVEHLGRPVLGELMDIGGVAARAEEASEQHVRLVLLGRGSVKAGDLVRRAGRILDVPAGPALLGRVVNPLGEALDARGPLEHRHRIRVERPQVPLADRELVSRPLRTGVFIIDTMIPIGRGQRQLVIGDRSTGKTELCLELLAALDQETIAVYVAIGRRGSENAATVEQLRRAGVLEHGFCVISDANDPLGLVHLSPYAATAMAESLVELGRDVVIVYDDLTSHANANRSLALLLGRPVGREAHPVDVFYAHARLLERAAQLSEGRGGGSLTALPIIETQAGDLTGYIPTNLVSITDGQIRLDAALLAAGLEPAIDVGLSVSRVGGKAQPALVSALSGTFKQRYAQFLELEAFARFGTRLESRSQAVVDWGRRARAIIHQGRGHPLRWAELVGRMLLLDEPRFVELPQARVRELVEQGVAELLRDPGFDAAAIDNGQRGAEDVPALRSLAAALMDRLLADQPTASERALGERSSKELADGKASENGPPVDEAPSNELANDQPSTTESPSDEPSTTEPSSNGLAADQPPTTEPPQAQQPAEPLP